MCNCWSVGLDTIPIDVTDKDKPVTIRCGLLDKFFSVDYCIADAVKILLKEDIVTRGSCCGHNNRYGPPSIIIDDHTEFRRARAYLDDGGFRNIWLKAWVLTDLDNL